ncbi:MAG: DedA family protein [Sedimentisphaerales bacterium]
MLIDMITHYGYVALFGFLMFGIMGFPMTEEFLLLYAGYNVSMNRMSLIPTIAAGALGAMCGVTVSYLVGRFIGLPAIHRFGRFLHITDENLQKIHDWFERWGKWTLTFGYFIPVVRHLSSIVAGTSKLAWHEFAVFAYSGALIWANAFVLTGFFLGPETLKIADAVSHNLTLLSIATLLSVTIVLFVRHYLMKRKKNANRGT